MSNASSHNIATYWTGIERSLAHRLESVRQYLKHPSSGINAENYFRALLRDYLPKRFGVEPGFVVNEAGEKSDFIDALVVDTFNIAPLSIEPTFQIFPAEAVIAAIEITSAPKSSVTRSGHTKKLAKLADDLLKLARARKLTESRRYLSWANSEGSRRPIEVAYKLPCRCYMISFGDEWSDWRTFHKHLISAVDFAKDHSDSAWLNAIWSLRHGMFYYRPYTESNETERIVENSLLEFIFAVNHSVSTVLAGPIDVRRYRPSAPELEPSA